MPLSQIYYHFGSKQQMVLELFEYLNAQLLERQDRLLNDTSLRLSEQWDRACDYLDEDISSGYVRVLQELIAVSWHDPAVAKVIRTGIMAWVELIAGLARSAEQKIGPLGPFSAEEVARSPPPASSEARACFARAGEKGVSDTGVAAPRRRPHSDRRG